MKNTLLLKSTLIVLLMIVSIVLRERLAEGFYSPDSIQTLHFYGAGTNTTFNVEFTIDINLTINIDNSVTGTLDATGLPNGTVICGAGDLTGTKQGNNITFSFTSFDPDPGCGFDHGKVNHFTAELSQGGRVLAGTYTTDNGQQGVFRAFSEDSWPDLSALERAYQNSIGTNQEPYIKQYLCIATESCDNFENQGSSSWANGFVRHLFEYTITSAGIPVSVALPCPNFFSDEVCFAWQGEFHFRYELEPGFVSYCAEYQGTINYDQWDIDHNNFLDNAIKPCLDTLANDGNLNSTYVSTLKVIIPARVKKLRETVQAFCLAVGLFENKIKSGKDFPELPPMPTKEELYSEALANNGDLTISANKFFVSVGEQIQLQVIERNRSKSLRGVNTNIEYHLNFDDSIATISSDGLLSIHSSPSPVTSTLSILYVAVKDGDKFGIRQFAITDADSDGDRIVDSYESKIGLNPQVANNVDADADRDLLPDILEALARTDPLDKDTDNDGISDSFEIYSGSNPLDENCTPFEGCVYEVNTLYIPIIRR